MKRFLALLLALLAIGCSQRYMVSDDLDYAYNLPPVGSTLEVKKPITVPAGEVRIFLQRGELFKKSDFDRYEPSCSLELRKLADVPREIQPGTFIVTKVERIMQQVVRVETPATGFVKAAFENGGKPMVVHGYHLWLGSDAQPDVMRMTCRGYFDDINRAEPPSLNDVTQSLGGYAELQLAI